MPNIPMGDIVPDYECWLVCKFCGNLEALCACRNINVFTRTDKSCFNLRMRVVAMKGGCNERLGQTKESNTI